MHTDREDSGGDTLPEFPVVVDTADSEFADRNERRPSAVRRTGKAFAEFAKEAPEMVIGFIEGLLP